MPEISCQILLNSLGLLFDILSVLILFKYGLPSKFHTPPGLLLEGDISNEEKKDNKKIKNLAHLGLFFLLIGFTLQLISNFI